MSVVVSIKINLEWGNGNIRLNRYVGFRRASGVYPVCTEEALAGTKVNEGFVKTVGFN